MKEDNFFDDFYNKPEDYRATKWGKDYWGGNDDTKKKKDKKKLHKQGAEIQGIKKSVKKLTQAIEHMSEEKPNINLIPTQKNAPTSTTPQLNFESFMQVIQIIQVIREIIPMPNLQ